MTFSPLQDLTISDTEASHDDPSGKVCLNVIYEVMYCEVYFVFLWQAVDHVTADADLEEFRRIRREQEMEFEESLRIDRRKVHTFHSLFSICVNYYVSFPG